MPINDEIDLSLLNIHSYHKDWDFANQFLYDMCQEYSQHNDKNIIVAKIWLIGRSYAAAIERRKKGSTAFSGDFYYDVVAPKMIECGEEIDRQIGLLKEYRKPTEENAMEILKVHKFLVDVFFQISKLNKRSLASKYLHFHAPKLFYIYDSRADRAIRKHVSLNKDLCSNLNYDEIDSVYGNFFIRMLDIQEYAKSVHTLELSPRDIDTFLLSYNWQ